jgi:tetratricopeptide (TPR) repeat protein
MYTISTVRLIVVVVSIGVGISLCSILPGCSSRSGDDFRAGVKSMEKGDIPRAISLLEKSVKKYPDSSGAMSALGIALYKAGRFEDSIVHLRKAVELDAGAVQPLEFEGYAQLALNKLPEARTAFQRAENIEPNNMRFKTAVAMVEMKGGNTRDAFRILMQVLDKEPNNAPALYNLAVLYRDRLSNRELAAKFFRKFLAVAPSDPHAAVAKDFLSPQTARVSPAEPLLKSARKAIASEDFDKAIEFFTAALKKDASNPDVLLEIAGFFDRINPDAKKAIEYYSKFRKLLPNDPRAQDALKRIDALTKSSAETAVKPSAAVVPSKKPAPVAGIAGREAETLFSLAQTYKGQGNLAMARDALSQAVRIKPEYVEASYEYADVCRGLKDNSSAITELNRILRVKPNFADAHYLLGVLYKEEGREDASKAHMAQHARLKKSASAR